MALPNGDLVRGGRGSSIEIWDTQKGAIKRTIKTQFTNSWGLGLLSNDDLVVVFRDNRTLVVFDLNESTFDPIKKIFQIDQFEIQTMFILKNDDIAIAYILAHSDIDIIDSKNGMIKKKLLGHKQTILGIMYAPNDLLVSCSEDKTVKFWDLAYSIPVKSLNHPTVARSIEFLKTCNLLNGLAD